jgi:hypothetical protein
MANKEPTVGEIALRSAVRSVLSALPARRRATMAVLRSGLSALGFAPTDAQLNGAIEWNHSRNFIDYARNHDIDQDEWFLTDRGRAKEGLA